MANTQSFDVEFNDSLLSYQGFTNPRYGGSKLIAKSINQYIDSSINSKVPKGTFPTSGTETGSRFRGWGGDISYGKNPVLTNHISAIFIGSNLTDGLENRNIVDVKGHSYANVDKILLINTITDDVQILDTQNVEEKAFKRFVIDGFKEGTFLKFKLLNSNIQHLLKKNHRAKFNEGALMKLYTYTPETGSSGVEDGVFGGWGNKHHSDATGSNIAGFTDNFAKHDGVEPSTDSPGGGLFGFGATNTSSATMFNTSSIKFVTQLPEELEEYDGELNLEIMGEVISIISSSYTPGSNIFELAGDK